MKRYIRSSMQLSDDEIVRKFEDAGLETTNNPREAIYLLRDGTLISGFYEGIRSEDHRCAECLFNDTNRYDPYFWDKLFETTGMAILHPETEKALIGKGQQLTEAQQEVLDELGYWVNR